MTILHVWDRRPQLCCTLISSCIKVRAPKVQQETTTKQQEERINNACMPVQTTWHITVFCCWKKLCNKQIHKSCPLWMHLCVHTHKVWSRPSCLFMLDCTGTAFCVLTETQLDGQAHIHGIIFLTLKACLNTRAFTHSHTQKHLWWWWMQKHA